MGRGGRVAVFECKLWQIIISLLLLLLFQGVCVCVLRHLHIFKRFLWHQQLSLTDYCGDYFSRDGAWPQSRRQRADNARPYQRWGGRSQRAWLPASGLWAIRVLLAAGETAAGVLFPARTRLHSLCACSVDAAALCVQLEIVNNVVIAFGPLSLWLLLLLCCTCGPPLKHLVAWHLWVTLCISQSHSEYLSFMLTLFEQHIRTHIRDS